MLTSYEFTSPYVKQRQNSKEIVCIPRSLLIAAASNMPENDTRAIYIPSLDMMELLAVMVSP